MRLRRGGDLHEEPPLDHIPLGLDHCCRAADSKKSLALLARESRAKEEKVDFDECALNLAPNSPRLAFLSSRRKLRAELEPQTASVPGHTINDLPIN
ncbi:hypothetical protein MJO29_013091 [Puccinia striiformis f. sp. tritici]|nr:hypothetical protein MJO29_013091 [Puccinia striiformis f. sp. tritici]